MKQNKSKAFKIMLASALGAVAFGCVAGGAASLFDIDAKAASAVSLVSLFDSENEAKVSAVEKKTVFTLPKRTNENSDKPAKVIFDRDIALAWHNSATEAGFFNTTFKLKDTNFSKLTIKMEATPAITMKEKKSVNEIIFKTVGTSLEISVKADGGNAVVARTLTDYEAGEITIGFAKSATGYDDVQSDEFVVLLSCGSLVNEPIGKFVNIGENVAEEYSDDDLEIDPLTFTAEFAEDAADDAKTEIEFVSLNGQSFDKLDDDDKVADDAKPVLVVNENVDSIALGTKFALDYQVIDVVDTSPTTTKQYYQYTPSDEKKDELPYDGKTLSSSTIFFDHKDVYGKLGKEYISIRFKLADDKYTGDEASFVELAWYTDRSETPARPEDKDEDDVRYKTSYIVATRNTEGPTYHFDAAKIEEYQALVDTEADKEDFTAGSNCYFRLPSLRGYVSDNDTAYQNLDFIVSYKSKNSDSATSTGTLSANGLKFSVATAGRYEFKVLVKDKAGNAPKYTLDGKLTEVTSSNIWDFDDIPSFWFNVKNKGLSVDDATSSTTDTDGFIDTKYSFDDFTVNGLLGTSEYELYYIDVAAFQTKYPNAGFSADSLSAISYSSIKTKAAEADRIGDDYMKDYLSVYVELLAENLGITDLTADSLLAKQADGSDSIMRKIKVDQGISKDDNPDEWKASDDAYEWDADEQTFKPQEAGAYLMLGVFTDSELVGERTAAYKAVSVSAKRDAIKGDTEWLKNNIASVILFSIAGVMLIAIIVLLVVKPSDETLEEVGADVKKSKKKEKTEEQAE